MKKYKTRIVILSIEYDSKIISKTLSVACVMLGSDCIIEYNLESLVA